MDKVGKTFGKKSSSSLSLDQFVSLTGPLIDLEKTVIMGKTLLELQPNRGDILPAHKFGTHDVVVLKPNKADPSSPSLGQRVVYRLKDSSITVAFDDIPEDGLNSPLRLENVANEVAYRRMKDALIQLSKGVQRGPAVDLVPVLFGEKPPAFLKKTSQFTPFNKNLDHSQDMVLLHRGVEVEFPDGRRPTAPHTLLEFGRTENGKKTTAMAALTVGFPAEIGALNKVQTRGVIRPPLDPEVYMPAKSAKSDTLLFAVAN